MEKLRQLARNILGYRSPIYRSASRLSSRLSLLSNESAETRRKLRRLTSPSCLDQEALVEFSSLDHPVHVRAGTADASTLIDNIVRREYGNLPKDLHPRWMIDAGAYIGDTSAYFLSRFKDLQMIALEPHMQNYVQAHKNLAPYAGRFILLQKGLAGSDEVFKFGGDSTGAGISTEGVSIDCVSIPTILEDYSIPRIDILKMDIEGAEKMVFEESPDSWIDQVDLILIELHGAEIEAFVLNVLREHKFKCRQYRSVWYCRRAQSI